MTLGVESFEAVKAPVVVEALRVWARLGEQQLQKQASYIRVEQNYV